MDISSSSRKSDSNSQNESDNTTNSNISPILESTSNQNEVITDNISGPSDRTMKESSESFNMELPQPAITKSSNSTSLVQILDEIPPPPYPTDSNIQILTPSHLRDHTTLTLTSPPEYNKIITTQPQLQAMPHPSHHRSISDVSSSLTNDDTTLISNQESKICKICHEPEEFQPPQDEEAVISYSNSYDKGKLISPCKCKGSLQYVHIDCLNQWRHSNVREEASYRCEVCKYEYKFYRPRIAKIFSSGFTLHFLSLSLLFSIIYLVSYIVKLVYMHKHYDDPNNPNDPNTPPPQLPGEGINWKYISFLNLYLIHFVIGTSIVSFLGLMFFAFAISCYGFRHTRLNYCYCGGFNSPCSSYGSCIGLDASGDCGGLVILLFLFIIILIFMMGFVGAIIAAYLFIQKITSFFLEEIHDRILEVNKN
ncbi:hypothetical protein C1645_747237 [Glomus cerebriforme]|uniref:RING-CH-type domain-containing protein n=1 Tax=Glomus cerebriforme TaxID=658196 RepID=A0A397TN51_9GLOM|nr:hypothetical protein C1645_747237 [Glomus cerebriforme]